MSEYLTKQIMEKLQVAISQDQPITLGTNDIQLLLDQFVEAHKEIERLKSGGSGDVDTLEELGITDEFREEAP